MVASEALGVQPSAPSAADPATPEVGAMCPPEWRLALEQAGAHFHGARVTGFGDGEAEPGQALTGDIMADLSHFGLIAVEGPDASKFLASLFTGDVRLVSPSQAQFTSWCDGKGRMLASFWLFMRGEAYYLLLPAELLPSILARLLQFRLRSKASITDASARLARLGLSGPGLSSRLAEVLGEPAPTVRGETLTTSDCTLISLGATPRSRWLVIAAVAGLKNVWEHLRPAALAVGGRAWSLLDILAGVPWLGTETSGEFVPQMVNLEALGGLCFTKGCYPGQEVVARLHYRGQLKRRLYLALIDSDRVPPAGAKLYGPGSSESVGMVISAAFSEPGKVALLAVVVIDQKALGEVRVQDLQGPRLEFQEPAIDVAVDA